MANAIESTITIFIMGGVFGYLISDTIWRIRRAKVQTGLEKCLATMRGWNQGTMAQFAAMYDKLKELAIEPESLWGQNERRRN